jgi:hypothetical protein
MTIDELVIAVYIETGAPEPDIHAAAISNWPSHSSFTVTQARLLTALIRRKAESSPYVN